MFILRKGIYFMYPSNKTLMVVMIMLLSILFASCDNVPIPPRDKDEPPVISIGCTDPTGKFSNVYKASQDALVDVGTQLVIFSSAYNSGGVKNNILSISPGNTYVRTSTPDGQGKVPKQLNITGDPATNPATPIRIFFTQPGQTIKIEASSENYNFMQTRVTLNFSTALPAPRIDYLKFTPRLPPKGHGEEDGYVNLGESATLIWNVLNCNSACTIKLVAKDGLNFAHQVFELNNLPAMGSHVVTPTEAFTKYFLTVSSPQGSDSRDYTQQIYIPH